MLDCKTKYPTMCFLEEKSKIASEKCNLIILTVQGQNGNYTHIFGSIGEFI